MTQLYLIRHCEAEGNSKGLLQGSIDLDITETGARQLEYLGKRFENIHLDRIYSSPLIRTQKTAHAVADRKGLNVEIYDGLRELDCGIFEGIPFAEIFEKYPEFREMWLEHPQDINPEGGEPMRVTYERIWEAVVDIARQNPDKTVACATHGGVTRCLLCRLLYGEIECLKDTGWTDNTAVTLLEFDDELNPRIVFLNDSSHVPVEFMPKRSKIASYAKEENK